jgi:hypothetical protein
MERFPKVEARDLEGRHYVLPDDLPDGRRLVIVPFQQWQQVLVEGWKQAVEGLQVAHEDLTVWEMPSLSRGYAPFRGYIDGGMRAGIPDPFVRQHTITSYADLGALTRSLGISSRDTIHLYLVDARGGIVWRESGEADAAKTASLAEALDRTSGAAMRG